MSLRDKLELGLKPDAPYRPDNLPKFQQNDPACQTAAEPGDSARQRRARDLCTTPAQVARTPASKPAFRPRRPATAPAPKRRS